MATKAIRDGLAAVGVGISDLITAEVLRIGKKRGLPMKMLYWDKWQDILMEVQAKKDTAQIHVLNGTY